MIDIAGNELGLLTNTGCPICRTAMYNTKDGLFWYCPKCRDWFDRGHKLKV